MREQTRRDATDASDQGAVDEPLSSDPEPAPSSGPAAAERTGRHARAADDRRSADERLGVRDTSAKGMWSTLFLNLSWVRAASRRSADTGAPTSTSYPSRLWKGRLSDLWRIPLLLLALGGLIYLASGVWGDLKVGAGIEGQPGKLTIASCVRDHTTRNHSYKCEGRFVPTDAGSPPTTAWEQTHQVVAAGSVVEVTRTASGEAMTRLNAWAGGLGVISLALFLFGAASVFLSRKNSRWGPWVLWTGLVLLPLGLAGMLLFAIASLSAEAI
ncbi:hypothetical protein [Micromonospora arborensis]|uniref:hypothetical protein n=1 Tax=Micromonospora arborensis TaxID=2116518 RepID=UPI003710788A